MGCGCGGASNVYKKPAEGKSAAKAAATPEGARAGFPAVWNGPKPEPASK